MSAPLLPPPALPAALVETLRASSAPPPPAARPCVAPPADDRLELLRAFVQRAALGRELYSARVLIRVSPLGDHEAWHAVAADLGGAGASAAWRVAERLGDGDLDAAVACAAELCGEPPEAWLAWAREERARKAGAR